jgi:hypothetical protein
MTTWLLVRSQGCPLEMAETNGQTAQELEKMLIQLEEQAKARGAEAHVSQVISEQANKAGLSLFVFFIEQN